MEEIGPAIASIFAATLATTPADAAAAGSAAAAGATAAGAGSATAAAAAESAAALAAGGSGLSTAGALTAASTAATLGGTAAQLLQAKPKTPNFTAPQLDQAQLEADQRNALLKRKGRAASLLTPGGAQGDTSTPNLGAAALLGSG